MTEELQFITLKANAAKTERRLHSGREYLVVPVVAVKAGVLNGEYLPASEIEEFVDAWNGRPVTLGHPQVNGEYVSANHPDLDVLHPGKLWNVYYDDERLKGEMWLDVLKCQELGDDALAAVQRFEAGSDTDVSTGYWRELEAGSGQVGNRTYNGIQRNLRPDHLAILLYEMGACSWADGCGAPRVNKGGLVGNSTQGTTLSLNGKSLIINQQDGVMIALFPSEEAVQIFSQGDGFPGEATAPEILHLTLGYFGTTEELSEYVDLGYALQDLAGFASRMPVVPAEVSGYARFYGEDDTDAIVSLVESPFLSEWRTQLLYLLEYSNLWVRNTHRFTPHVTLGYAPNNAGMPASLPAKQPIVFDRLGFAWGGQVTLFQLQGEAMTVQEEASAEMASNQEKKKQRGFWQRLKGVFNREHETGVVESVEVHSEAEECMCDNKGGTVAANAGNGKEAQEVVSTELKAQEIDWAKLMKDAVSEGLAPYKGMLDSIQANADRERNELIADLAANANCPFDEAELKEFDTLKLHKMADAWQTVPVANYGGRGGVRTHGSRDVEEVLEMPEFSTNGNGGK